MKIWLGDKLYTLPALTTEFSSEWKVLAQAGSFPPGSSLLPAGEMPMMIGPRALQIKANLANLSATTTDFNGISITGVEVEGATLRGSTVQLPGGVGIGSSRADIERHYGAPLQTTDDSLLYSDAARSKVLHLFLDGDRLAAFRYYVDPVPKAQRDLWAATHQAAGTDLKAAKLGLFGKT